MTTTSLLLLALASSAAPEASVRLTSPDGRLAVTFELGSFGVETGCPTYRVDLAGRTVLATSRLGLELEDGGPLRSDLEVVAVERSEHDGTWRPVCGERAEVRDHYRKAVIDLKETSPSGRRLRVTLRAYDEGIAFSYTIPEQGGLERGRIRRELSEFRFDGDHTAWATYSGQGAYSAVPLSRVRPNCERPLVVRVADDLYAAIAEAKLVDYARMRLAPLSGVAHALASQLHGPVESALPLTTPWRVVMATSSPGELLEGNHIILSLNDPCAIDDPSWIRPGKVIREVSLTTDGGKACVEFAVKTGLQFVEYDAGWYGHEYDDASDARAVDVDPRRSKGPLDLREVIRYAAERGIGIIVYVNRRALEKQLDELLPLYREWGISGIKFGFVNVGSQRWTRWLHDAIAKCAEHRLMVDVHDEYRVTGFSRTYPNLTTVEGIRGDETKPTNDQTLTYAFTRMIAGRADNTVCWTDGRVRANATHAYQLAKPICLFSPWQFLFWYDRPSAIWDTPELELYRHLPTTWDETKVLHGRIGELAVIARRRGDEWYVGCMNGLEAATLDLPLDFLGADGQWTAHIYSTDPTVKTPTRVKIERRPVTRETALRVVLPARDGQAIRLTR